MQDEASEALHDEPPVVAHWLTPAARQGAAVNATSYP